jgi:Protein of unknown function (DUF2786)
MSSAKDKIRKLLSIAADKAASEHEIELCLAKADRLMQDHHLSEADLFDNFDALRDSAFNGKFMKRTVHAARKCYRWEYQLSVFVQRYVGGLGCFSRSGAEFDDNGQRYTDNTGVPFSATIFVFFGLHEDIELAECLFTDLRQAIMGLAKAKHHGCFRGPGASYALGFVAGLFTQMKQRRETERLTAKARYIDADERHDLTVIERRDELVQLKEDCAYDWLASEAGGGIRLHKRSSRGKTASQDAYLQGKTDGAQHEFSDGVTPRIGFND